ncbi:MAG: proteinMgtE intracellular protein [Acidimicrobiales bacterium]|nr:proteinMgtE intracellular protein [Acidimicrobiales bacterium]
MVERARSPRSPVLRALRSPRPHLAAERQAARRLISLAGLVGQPIRNPDGSEVGRVADLVARWEGDPYPQVTGIVAKIGRRHAFISMAKVADLEASGARLSSARLDLVEFARRAGEVVLAGDVLDHQLVDVDGVQVIRAADLFVARVGAAHRLVGVDVSVTSLLRRLGPRRFRSRATPGRVIDWSLIQPLGAHGNVRLTLPNRELHRLRPGEIADLLEALGRSERHELLDALAGETAADALEEMEPAELAALLRDAPVERAADLLAAMEPDEAVDALRDLSETDRLAIFEAMSEPVAQRLQRLLRYRPDTAGGVMTTVMVTTTGERTVGELREVLRSNVAHSLDIDAVLVLDDDGRVLDDVTLFELITADPEQRMLELIGEPWPVTVTAESPVVELVEALRENRRSSTVVVDEDGRPLGRVLADDLLDAMARNPRPSAFSRLPS